MAPVHFKSAVQAVTAASTLNKKVSKFQCNRKKCQCVLEDCTNHVLRDPPQHFAATGNLDTLKEAIKTFGLTLKETDKNLSTLLHHASSANQTEVMQYLIENGAELDAADKDGYTALHSAACKGSIDAICLLLDSGASTTATNSMKDAPLHTASKEKSGRSFRAFLTHSRVDWGLKGFRNRTILHAIAELDNLECLKVLREEMSKRMGGTCRAHSSHTELDLCLCNKDNDGLTAVHLAARMNSYQVLEHMIQQCKSHNADCLLGYVDDENGTPLHTAVDAGHLEVACVMLRYGADPLALRGDIPPPLHLACSQGRVEMLQAMMESCGVKVLQSLDQNGRSPLHYSAFSIHSCSVISYMADQCKEEMYINQQDNRGRTPLHMSISSGNLAGVKEFLARGADPFIKDNEGHNALHFAVIHNRKAIIMALRELTPHSDDLANETNAKGYSPVHIGLRLGLKDIVSILISSIQLQPKNVKDPHGNNYIHLAASSGDWKALTAFLDLTNASKLLNETNNHGATPLHYASKNGHAQCIELLLNSGAMAHKSHKGVSPLMLASREGHMECVKILYKAHPFQTNWQDDDGDTALHYAAHSGNPAMVQQILDLGGEIVHNDSGKSFLDIIIAKGSEDCGLAVVNHRRWQECLDVVSPVLEHPMLNLVRRMPAIAKAVLDRCHTVKRCEHSETFNFKYLLTKYTSDQDQGLHPSPGPASMSAPKRQPSVHGRGKKLLQEVAIKDLEMVDADINRMTIHRRRSTFINKQLPTLGKKRKASLSMEVLKRMIQHKRVDLLVHPVVSAYLKKKWNSYGRLIYLLYSGSLAMLVFSLTMFVILSPIPALRDQFKNVTQNISEDVLSYNKSEDQLLGSNASDNATVDGNMEKYSNAQAIFRWLAVISNILFTIDTLAGLLVHGLQSVNFVERILLWNSFIAIILNFVFLLAQDPFAPKVLPFGAGACFFTWMVLFGALEFFDVVGVYVNMFFKILRTVFHVLFVCIFLLMAFALAMYVVASGVTEFSTVGFSIFSVFGYMLGEVQYSLFIEKASSREDHLQNSNVIILLITVLAVMMSIVMANLLIGLAVGDIEQIKINAVYNRRALEVVFFTQLDHYAPKCVGRIIAPDSWTIHHNRAKQSWKRLLDYLKSMVKTEVLDIPEFHEDEIDHQRSSNAPPVDIALEMTQIKQKLQDMSDVLHNLQEGFMEGSQRDCRRRNLCWQKPQTSTLSIDSSNSDISMTASDFLADLA